MILAHAVGQRDESTCHRFLDRLNKATVGRMQVTSDGLGLYTYNVPFALGSRVDFAQLIKSYSSSQEETRYSPAQIIKSDKVARFGSPDMGRVQHVLRRALEFVGADALPEIHPLDECSQQISSPPRGDDQHLCGVVQLLSEERSLEETNACNVQRAH